MGTWESAEERTQRDAWWAEALENPSLKARFDEINAAVKKGDLTLAQVGGFTDQQIDSAYAACCKLINTGRVREAMQISGYLILLEPWDARFYYLAAVCFHHEKKFEQAVRYYGVALAFEEGATTLFAKGEALLMLGRRGEAREALARGIEIADTTDPDTDTRSQRARRLLDTYLEGGPQ